MADEVEMPATRHVRECLRNLTLVPKQPLETFESCSSGCSVAHANVTLGAGTIESFSSALTSLLRELDDHARPRIRPNPFTDSGAVLNTVHGLDGALQHMVRAVSPAVIQLFPEVGSIDEEDFLAFLVAYAPNRDSRIEVHEDESFVTVNMCIGEKFDGGDLVLAGSPDTRLVQTVGQALVHSGGLPHYTDHVTKGIRINLVLWLRPRRRKHEDRFCDKYIEYLTLLGTGNGVQEPPARTGTVGFDVPVLAGARKFANARNGKRL